MNITKTLSWNKDMKNKKIMNGEPMWNQTIYDILIIFKLSKYYHEETKIQIAMDGDSITICVEGDKL